MFDGVVHFKFQDEYVAFGLYHHIRPSEDALHLGVDLAVQQGEDHIHEQFVEGFALLPCHPLLLADDVVRQTGDVGAQLEKHGRQFTPLHRTCHGKDCGIPSKVVGVHKVVGHAVNHALTDFIVREMEDI